MTPGTTPGGCGGAIGVPLPLPLGACSPQQPSSQGFPFPLP